MGWLSSTAAEGLAVLPAFLRTRSRSLSCSRSHVPSACHLRNQWNTMLNGGKSCGNARQVQPLRVTYKIALMISRFACFGGRPVVASLGIQGSIRRHCDAVRSVG